MELPVYNKIEIDPEDWPKSYWDNSLRCEPCEVMWPPSHFFYSCPYCQKATIVVKGGTPDMRWPDAVKILLEEQFEAYYLEWNKAKIDWEDIKTDGKVDMGKLKKIAEDFIKSQQAA